MTFRLSDKYQLHYCSSTTMFSCHTMFLTCCSMFRMKDVWNVRHSRRAIFGICNVWDVGCLGCRMFGKWNVWDVGCSECKMLGMQDVQDVECFGCGVFGILGMLGVQDVGCWGCKMFRMWDIGCFLGCGMLVYKMPLFCFINI